MSKVVNVKGKKFGRLTVVEFDSIDPKNGAKWRCVCDCGHEIVVLSHNLRTGNTKSCGCIPSENARILSASHGLSRTAEYTTWVNMIQRCTNSKSTYYGSYGGRGIKVCDRWLHSFLAFYEDMKTKPSAKHSIDRIDVNGNYEPNNCKWSTDSEQMSNRRPYKKRKRLSATAGHGWSE